MTSGASALAAGRSVVQLRRAFTQTFLAVRETGNASVCSDATPEGQIALTQIVSGDNIQEGSSEAHYLPSVTCRQAFSGWAAKVSKEWEECSNDDMSAVASFLAPDVKRVVIHVRHNHATVQLADDLMCGEAKDIGEDKYRPIGGAEAVKKDPMGVSYWVKRHGHWLLADKPTGTYSRAGRQAVTLLRAAISGRSVTLNLTVWTVTAPFCGNGTTQMSITPVADGVTSVSPPAPWYVAAGFVPLGGVHNQAPFDAQGNPQGELILPIAVGVERLAVKLVGGTLTVTELDGIQPLPIGSAGC